MLLLTFLWAQWFFPDLCLQSIDDSVKTFFIFIIVFLITSISFRVYLEFPFFILFIHSWCCPLFQLETLAYLSYMFWVTSMIISTSLQYLSLLSMLCLFKKKMCLSCSISLLLLFFHLLSCARLCATPWTAARQVSLSFTISQSLLKLMSIESVMTSNHLILCHPLLLQPSIFPSIRVFLTSQLFASGGWSIGTSASASVLPMNTQDWSPVGWTGWISLQSKGLSRIFYNTTVQKHQFFGTQSFLWSNSHIHTWPLEKL